MQRELDALPEADCHRVTVGLQALGENPRPPGCEKLSDAIYRIRAGHIRVIYWVDEATRTIEVGAVRRRRESIYRRLEDLFRDRP